MPPRKTTREDYRRRILAASSLLEKSLDAPIDPSALAKASAFSLHHFHRIFRGQLGESVMEHVRRLRLERAARRLLTSDAKVIEVALEAGYDSHEGFTRAFVDRFGVAPSRFRETTFADTRLARLPHELPTPSAPRANIEVRRFDELRVAYMRHRGSYRDVGETWQKLRAFVAEHALPDALYGLCPDDPDVTAERHLRFDACVVVPAGFGDDRRTLGEAELGIVPAGTYAVGLHVGPFETLAETYLDVVGRWFPTSGYELGVDAVVEHYLDDPRTTPREALRTEVRVRIAEDR